VNNGACAMLSHPPGGTSPPPNVKPHRRAPEEAINALSAHWSEGSLRRPRQVAAGHFRWRSYGGSPRGASPPLLSESKRAGAEPDVEVRIVRAFSIDPGRREALRLRRERMLRHVTRGRHRYLAGLRHLRCQRPASREWRVLQVRRECVDRPDVSARHRHHAGVRHLRCSRSEPHVRRCMRVRRERVDGPDSMASCSHQPGVRCLRASRPEPAVRGALRLRRKCLDGPNTPAA
jgi:hypothetical protein